MSRGSVFVDSSALLALLNSRDSLHEESLRVEAALIRARTMLFTSDWVLSEFLSSASSVAGRDPAARMVRAMRKSKRATILAAVRSDWDEAFELFASVRDKDWSLVDCTSILTYRRFGINRVFTHDHHFRQAGFEVLLK